MDNDAGAAVAYHTMLYFLSWFDFEFLVSPCTWAKVQSPSSCSSSKTQEHSCQGKPSLYERTAKAIKQLGTYKTIKPMGCAQSKKCTTSAEKNWDRVPSVIRCDFSKYDSDRQSTPAKANRPVIYFGIPNDIIYSYKSIDNSLSIVSSTARKTDIEGSLETDAPFVGGYQR